MTHRGPFQPLPFCDSVKIMYLCLPENISSHWICISEIGGLQAHGADFALLILI